MPFLARRSSRPSSKSESSPQISSVTPGEVIFRGDSYEVLHACARDVEGVLVAGAEDVDEHRRVAAVEAEVDVDIFEAVETRGDLAEFDPDPSGRVSTVMSSNSGAVYFWPRVRTRISPASVRMEPPGRSSEDVRTAPATWSKVRPLRVRVSSETSMESS